MPLLSGAEGIGSGGRPNPDMTLRRIAGCAAMKTNDVGFAVAGEIVFHFICTSDEGHVMVPIPVGTGIVVGIAVWIDAKIRTGPRDPGAGALLVMSDDVIAVFGVTKSVAFVARDSRG